METKLTPIEEAISEWQKAKNALVEAALAVKKEQELRKKVISLAFPAPVEGVNKLMLQAGWVLKANCPVTRDVDEAAFKVLIPRLTEVGIIPDTLVRYKIELEVKNYKGLSDASRALFDQVLTIKPGSYSLELIAPPAINPLK